MRPGRIVLANCLALVLGLVPLDRALASGTNDARAQGFALYREGRFNEAIPFFDQVLARHPRDLEVLIKRGACSLRLDQPEQALRDFDRVNQYTGWASRLLIPGAIFNPNTTWIPIPLPVAHYAESWGNRGIALLMLGRDEDALESFLYSERLWKSVGSRGAAAGRASALQGAGQAYHRLGQAQLAVQLYVEAISTNPADPNGFVGRGDVLASLSMLDPAIADYSEAIRLDPAHAQAFSGRGRSLADLGKNEGALTDLDRALAIDPKSAITYSYRGAVHARLGHNLQALADYDALIRLVPENAGAYKDRGGVLVRMGRFDRAIDDLSTAIRLDPKRATAYQNRGAAYNGLGQYERAIDDLSKAIEINPDNAGAYTNRGLALFAVGRYDQSVVDLSEAIELAPRNAVLYYNRGEVFTRLGLRDRALEDYNEAIRLDPRIAAAHAASGHLREQLGERDQAIREYDMALQLDPTKVSVYHDRGSIRRQRGDWQGAIADYDRAIVLDPNRAETYVARGWSRLSAGVAGADDDARAFIALKGWHDGLAPYMAVLAVLAAREAGRPADVNRMVDEALANVSPRQWPAPVLWYLAGVITEPALLQAAVSDRQQAEVHTFLGLECLQRGDRAAALAHLRWARDHAPPGSIAADVALARLKRHELDGQAHRTER